MWLLSASEGYRAACLNWYKLKVLVGGCPTEELAYTMQYNSCFEALRRAGISVESITYIIRKKEA
jgi:hypothetical protein